VPSRQHQPTPNTNYTNKAHIEVTNNRSETLLSHKSCKPQSFLSFHLVSGKATLQTSNYLAIVTI
jgi:hypothetical protein